MSRDFAKNINSKKTASYGKGRNTRTKSQTPPWIWLILGIAVGLIIAAVMYLKVHPLKIKEISTLKREGTLTHESHRTSHNPSHNQSQIAKNAEPQPQFDFYNILPKMQVGATDSENALASANVNNTPQVNPQKLTPPIGNLTNNNNPPAKSLTPTLQTTKQKIAAPANYILQVAAFKHFKDADKLRAELTLLGFNVAIKPTSVNNRVWNRVWIGPFKNQKTVAFAQKELAEHKLKGILIKNHG